MGLGQLGSSEGSDFQQQESRDCWGAESLDAVRWKTWVQLPAALAEIVAEQDETQVQLKT
jgi:hypothetical protein